MKKKILITAVIFLFFFIAGAALKTQAGTGENTSGWGWGGGAELDGVAPWDGTNTNVRWISMNSTNTGGAFSYGINIPAAGCVDPNCNVTGNAWSGGDDSGPGLGYINFDPAGPYPNLPNNSVIRNGDYLEGWARFEEIRIAGGNSGGWSGWIKMRGTATNGSPYGVEISKMDGKRVGEVGDLGPTYAWSDELGWIDFGGAKIVVVNNLKICRNSCDSASKIDNGSIVLMIPGDTTNLKACFNPDAGCGTATGDVTAATGWTANDTPDDAVDLTGTDPKVITAKSTAVAKSENVSATYLTNPTVGFTATVVPLPLADCWSCNNGTCTQYQAASCGSDYTDAATCSANCKAGGKWIEVAP